MKNELLKMGGEISKRTEIIVGIVGFIVLMCLWYLITINDNIVPSKILPNPVDVIKSYPSLISDSDLFGNMWYTIKLNLLGYCYALIIAVPLGFIIGLFPITKALFNKYIDALRYLPLPAISGIFIAMLGLGFDMKASFLAFGILIYILPVIVQRINELQNPANDKDYVYLQIIKTLGTSSWQKFRYVYWPYITQKISTDIINLTAISYTYIVIAEVLNKDGGIGALINTMSRQSRTAEMYALLFLIIFIGVCQDIILRKADTILFPSKYNKKSINWNWLTKLIYK